MIMLLQTYQLDWKADFEAIKGVYENLLMNIDSQNLCPHQRN